MPSARLKTNGMHSSYMTVVSREAASVNTVLPLREKMYSLADFFLDFHQGV